MTQDFEHRLLELQNIINKAKKIVFLGGAGVSTASGIPDFRSKNGLYNKIDRKYQQYQPEYLLSRDCLLENPELFLNFIEKKWIAEICSPISCILRWQN